MSRTETQVLRNPKELCQIDVAINLCSKPNLKELYTRPEGSQEVWLFLWKQHVHVVPLSRGQEVTGIELAGTHAALQNFYDTFLIDEPVQARELHYRPEGNLQGSSLHNGEPNSSRWARRA